MTLEVGRRFVNGRWTTDIENEGEPGGGGISEITSDDSSVTITNPSGPTVDLSVSGGSQPLLGPFTISFDDLSTDNNDPTVLGDIPAGTLVMGVAVIILTNWNWDAGTLSLSTAPATDVTDSSTFALTFELLSAAWTGAKHQATKNLDALVYPFKTTSAQKLVCIADGVTGTATAGSAEVYLNAFTL